MAKDKTSGMAPEAEAKLQPWGGNDGSDAHRSIDVGPVAAPLPAPAQIPRLPQRQRSLLVPVIFVANVIMFVITIYVNNCPKNSHLSSCILRRSLGRFSFQPLKQNPLFGPSTQTFKEKRWDSRRLLGSGGMPSSHSATVTALAVAVGLQEGIGSNSFALAVILASIDAKKGVLFIDFPPVLQLQLKHFEYDFMRDTMVKMLPSLMALKLKKI